MFSDGWPAWAPDESHSDVDSNEKAVQEHPGPEEIMDSPRVENTNSTIASREEVMRQLTMHPWRTNHWNNDVALRQTPQRWSGQYYLDDDVPLEEAIQDEVRSANNWSQRAAGSNDTVVIPTRSPTVPPPPAVRHLPPLEIQRVAPEVDQRDRTDREEASSENQESTDSGEFTIKDGSEPSSGGFQTERYEDSQAHQGHGEGRSVGASRVLTATALASLPEASSGWKIVQYKGHGITHSEIGWEWLWIGFALGIVVGGALVVCVCCTSFLDCRTSHPFPSRLRTQLDSCQKPDSWSTAEHGNRVALCFSPHMGSVSTATGIAAPWKSHVQ